MRSQIYFVNLLIITRFFTRQIPQKCVYIDFHVLYRFEGCEKGVAPVYRKKVESVF